MRPRPRLSHALGLGAFVLFVVPLHGVAGHSAHAAAIVMLIVAFVLQPRGAPKNKIDDPNGLRWYQNPDNYY